VALLFPPFSFTFSFRLISSSLSLAMNGSVVSPDAEVLSPLSRCELFLLMKGGARRCGEFSFPFFPPPIGLPLRRGSHLARGRDNLPLPPPLEISCLPSSFLPFLCPVGVQKKALPLFLSPGLPGAVLAFWLVMAPFLSWQEINQAVAFFSALSVDCSGFLPPTPPQHNMAGWRSSPPSVVVFLYPSSLSEAHSLAGRCIFLRHILLSRPFPLFPPLS